MSNVFHASATFSGFLYFLAARIYVNIFSITYFHNNFSSLYLFYFFNFKHSLAVVYILFKFPSILYI